MTLSNLSSILCGKLFGEDTQITSLAGHVSTDTRTLKNGDIYLALKGPSFDGNEFVGLAQQKGALAVIVQKYIESLNVAQIVVEDGLKALSALAAHHRKTLNAKVCAITGSTGKTTVKGMLRDICIATSGSSKSVNATYKNLNNHIGVPKTILETDSSVEYLIVEAGMSHPGEIAPLTKIIDPNVALVNNIAPSHIEAFKSLDGIAVEKSEIYQHSKQSVTCIVNADDKYASFFLERCGEKSKIDFSIETKSNACLIADDIVVDELGRASFSLNVHVSKLPFFSSNHVKHRVHLRTLGAHNIKNALAASACAIAMNIKLDDVVKGLNVFSGEPGRMQCITLGSLKVIDDSYNANPESMKAAISYLSGLHNTVLILGDMGELGAYAKQAHTETATFAKKSGIRHLYVCGDYSDQYEKGFGGGITVAPSQEELANIISRDILNKKISNMSTILVKGSRSSKMEKVIQYLQKSEVLH